MGTGDGVLCDVAGLLWKTPEQHLTYVVMEKNVAGHPAVRPCVRVSEPQQ